MMLALMMIMVMTRREEQRASECCVHAHDGGDGNEYGMML